MEKSLITFGATRWTLKTLEALPLIFKETFTYWVETMRNFPILVSQVATCNMLTGMNASMAVQEKVMARSHEVIRTYMDFANKPDPAHIVTMSDLELSFA